MASPGNGASGASGKVKAIVVLVVLGVWAGTTAADVALGSGYDQPWPLHAIAFGVFGWALGGRFVTDWSSFYFKRPNGGNDDK